MNPSSPSSIAGLAKACTSKFSELLSIADSDLHVPLQNRAADFQLWVDGVGAVAKPGASLDSRLRDRPNDWFLTKGILAMLVDFLSEVPIKGLSPDKALINVDSALSNLAMIGVAIRRTGKASRSRRADQSFNPDHYKELRRHLECMILLRPSKYMHECEGFDASKAIDSKELGIVASNLQEMVSCRLGQLGVSNLTGVQSRLVDANLRRRHRFILAQKRSQHIKTAQQGAHQATHHEETSLPEAEPHSGEVETNTAILVPNKKAQGLPERKPQAAQTIAFLSTASTAEGTMQYDPRAKYVPTVAQSQISSIANDIEFPRVSLASSDRHIIECPCCCQPLPYEEVSKATNWRQHLIEDICPYSCIAEQCPTPHLLFATRNAWEIHVENDHPCQWNCIVCGQAEATFSNISDITSHIQSDHQEDLSCQSITDLIQWSRVQRMGIKSCPLCSDYGPEDSPELVDHVIKHAYDFALRSLPWSDAPVEDLNKPIGTYSMPEDSQNAARLENWLQHAFCGTVSSIRLSSFDYADHNVPVAQELAPENYYASHTYFDQNEAAGSRLAAGTEAVNRTLTADDRQPSLQRTEVLEHPGAVHVKCTLVDAVHGFWGSSEPSTPATLLILEFVFDPQKRGRRIVKANIELAFFNSKEEHLKTPDVASISFDGCWSLAPSETVETKTTFEGRGAWNFRSNRTVIKETKDSITIRGSKKLVDSLANLDNAAVWTLQENATNRSGLPTSMRVGILLKRPFDEADDVFECRIKLDAEFDFRTRLENVFSRQTHDDPILFSPSMSPRNNMVYDADNLGAVDLSSISEVTLVTSTAPTDM